MDKTELAQLNRTLTTAIQRLGKVLNSLAVLNTWDTCADVSDIMKLTQIETVNSSLAEFMSISSTLTDRLNAYERPISRTIRIGSSETLTDDTIYALYSLAKKRRDYIYTNPDSEIVDAVNHIASWTWGCDREKIEFKDGTILLNRQLAVPKNLPDDAISADNVALFCIGMNLGGKQLSFTLLRHLIARRCVNILEYIVRNEKKLRKTISPGNLLLTTLIEWPSPDVKSPLQVLVAIEETYPGTIKSAEDAYGNNTLWFAAPLIRNQPNNLVSEIGKYFASCGCDLDKPFKAGFSWNTMVHVMSIIEHHE